MGRRLATLFLLAIVGAAAPSRGQVGTFPMCDLDAPDDCCRALPPGRLSCDASAPAELRSPRRKNVLLIVGDDNGYCHHGFMQGLCSESSKLTCPAGTCADPAEQCVRGRCIKPCVSNIACTGICGSSATLMADVPADERPLRLDDPACRNRQPPRPGFNPLGWCANHLDENGHFQYRRDFPCAGTPGYEDQHVRTPHLDQLASEGAVFSRAHIPGDSCKPARVGILLGMANVHTQALAGSSVTCALDDPLSFNGIGCFLPEHRSYLWGKGEIGSARSAGFEAGMSAGNPSLGKLRGGCRAVNCEQRLLANKMPVRVPDTVVPPPDSTVSVSGIDDRIFPSLATDLARADDAQGHNAHLSQPFFVWYAPNIPHDGGAAPKVLKKWYDTRLATGDPTAATREKKVFEFLARDSLFDIGVGALVDGLKRRCVCDADGQPSSLYDNTVVIYVHDTGFVLPEAKQRPTENGHRSPIIINEPGHRLPGAHVAPRQFPDDLASATDLLTTIASYASEPEDPPVSPTELASCGPGADQQGYPFVRNLCRAVKGDPSHLRRLLYGHDSDVPLEGGAQHYLDTRPGELGVCGAATTASGHARPCRVGQDAQCGPGDTCRSGLGRCSDDPSTPCVRDDECAAGTCDAPVDGGGGRCANHPGTRCALDADCAEPWCPAGTCTNTADYVEFAGKPCGAASDCMPHGVCRELSLKLQVGHDGGGPTRRLWDVNWDPDQVTELLGADPPFVGDPDYLDVALMSELETCLGNFWDLARNPATQQWELAGGCPFEP